MAQTGPVSYTVQTAEGYTWRRHVDQLLQATAAPPVLPSVECDEDSPGGHASIPVSPPGGASILEGPVPDLPSGVLEPAPPFPVAPPTPSRDIVTDFPSEQRYPTRQRRPPDRLNL